MIQSAQINYLNSLPPEKKIKNIYIQLCLHMNLTHGASPQIYFSKIQGSCMGKIWLGLTVSTQKTIIKTEHPSLAWLNRFGLPQTKPSRFCSYLKLGCSVWIIVQYIETVSPCRFFPIQLPCYFETFIFGL
jgi:hypothetical protein